MPKQRKRDGIFWRKDRKQWWVSYMDADRKRVREPVPDVKDSETQQVRAASHEEAQVYREEKRQQARDRKNRRAALGPGEILPTEETFAEVADRYLAYQKPRLLGRNSYQREAGIANQLKTFFTGKLRDITSSQVSDFITERLGKVSKSSVQKELVVIKHLFRLACGSEWKLLERFANPAIEIKAPKVRNERTQHLTPEQFRRVLATAPDGMKPIFALLTATGMRRSELLDCKWGYVDSTRILLPTSKNADPKEVHLNVFAQRVLASLPQGGPDDLLFPGVTGGAVSMAFQRVCQVLRIPDMRLHDLRHTFATWLRQRGVELDVIASQLGHRDLRMTKRYARIAAAQVGQAVGGLDVLLLPATEESKGFHSGRDREESLAPSAGIKKQFLPETVTLRHRFVTGQKEASRETALTPLA